jgi:hypothetical protein
LVNCYVGCGDAKIAKTVKKHKVLSFDLVSRNELVQVADSANVHHSLFTP